MQCNFFVCLKNPNSSIHGGNINNAASNFWLEACCFNILFCELSASFVINLVLCQPTIQQQYIIHDSCIDCLHMRFLHLLLHREATIFAFSCYRCFFVLRSLLHKQELDCCQLYLEVAFHDFTICIIYKFWKCV